MRVAVAYDDGLVYQHFGKTKRFKIYDIEKGKTILATTIHVGESGHGALADILKKCGVEALICGGIGSGAKRALSEVGIDLYCGVKGETDNAISELVLGNLEQSPPVQGERVPRYAGCEEGGAED